MGQPFGGSKLPLIRVRLSSSSGPVSSVSKVEDEATCLTSFHKLAAGFVWCSPPDELHNCFYLRRLLACQHKSCKTNFEIVTSCQLHFVMCTCLYFSLMPVFAETCLVVVYLSQRCDRNEDDQIFGERCEEQCVMGSFIVS